MAGTVRWRCRFVIRRMTVAAAEGERDHDGTGTVVAVACGTAAKALCLPTGVLCHCVPPTPLNPDTPDMKEPSLSCVSADQRGFDGRADRI
jgi:hypothetical protein